MEGAGRSAGNEAGGPGAPPGGSDWARHASRQVAAGLLREAPADVARDAWTQLVGDPSRTVRRAALDAIVDAGREELRPLLETALTDADAWVRWKALRGLAELGAGPSRLVVEPLIEDPDCGILAVPLPFLAYTRYYVSDHRPLWAEFRV